MMHLKDGYFVYVYVIVRIGNIDTRACAVKCCDPRPDTR